MPDGSAGAVLARQLDLSAGSLRAHNRTVPLVLCLYGSPTAELSAVCAAHGVTMSLQGSYEARLAASCPSGWPALARYPLLHKLLGFAALDSPGLEQVLYLDCDTVLFDDVEALFDRYRGPDLVAREEVHTSRSHLGPDRDFVDEALLAHLAAADGASDVAPFNLGVVLLDNGCWRHLAALEPVLIDYAWRFIAGMALASPAGPDAAPRAGAAMERYGTFAGLGEARAGLTAADAGRALPYPSQNHWILDEVATWLALGHLHGLRTADFDRRHVAQDGEFLVDGGPWPGCVVGHYFSQNSARLEEWLATGGATRAGLSPTVVGAHPIHRG